MRGKCYWLGHYRRRSWDSEGPPMWDEECHCCCDDEERRCCWEEKHRSWDEDAAVAGLAGGGAVDWWWLVSESWKGVEWDVSRCGNERERGVGSFFYASSVMFFQKKIKKKKKKVENYVVLTKSRTQIIPSCTQPYSSHT